MEVDDACAEAQDGELDGLWTTITIFISLFLLSVCYSAAVTLFKVSHTISTVSTPSSHCSSYCLCDQLCPTLSHAIDLSYMLGNAA